LFPLLYAILPFDPTRALFASVTSYSLVASALFLLVEWISLRRLRGHALFWPSYFALFLNPLLLAYVPYPAPESLTVTLFVGAVPWLTAAERPSPDWRGSLGLGLFLGALFALRPLDGLLVLPGVGLLSLQLYRMTGTPARAAAVALFAGGLGLMGLTPSFAAAPDSASFAPGLRGEPRGLGEQVQGYAKVEHSIASETGRVEPRVYWNPLNCESEEQASPRDARVFTCLLGSERRRSSAGATVFTAAIHFYNALNYDSLRLYATDGRLPLFSLLQLLSSAVVFLGAYAGLRALVSGTVDRTSGFLIGSAAACLLPLPFVVVGARSGLLATASLSLLAVRLLLGPALPRREIVALSFGIVFFLIASSLLSVYVLALAGSASP